MTEDLTERRLRSELDVIAAAVLDESTRLTHPEDRSVHRPSTQTWQARLAAVACTLLTLALTLGVASWGRFGRDVAPPASPPTVNAALDDLRAIEAGRSSLRGLVKAAQNSCMARRGFHTDLWGPGLDVAPPTSALSGRRTLAEAEQLGYGILADATTHRLRAGAGEQETARYDTAIQGESLPGWAYQVPGGERVGGWLRRLTSGEGCSAVAVREVWGPNADELLELANALRGPLDDATPGRVLRNDDPDDSPAPGALRWRRCMVRDAALFPQGDPAPRENLGSWIESSLMSSYGYREGTSPVDLSQADLDGAARRERALAVRDVRCSVDPVVRAAALDTERFQMAFALRRDPGLADELHRWRRVVDQVRARHGV